MKRILSLVLLLALLLCGCGGPAATHNVAYNIGPSLLFGEGEIRAAMDEVRDGFERQFSSSGCTLLSLTYDEEVNERKAGHWEEQYGAEVIIILTDFYVNEDCEPGPLTPGQTYRNYEWVLTRSGLRSWILRDGGYA